MVDRAIGETLAHGEAGMPGPDDGRGNPANASDSRHGGPLAYFTETVTLVGLVTISNTAERFWDWATNASMSSRLASASMS